MAILKSKSPFKMNLFGSFSSGVVLVNALTLGPAFLHPRMVGGVPGEHTADAQEPVVAESNTEAESVIILSESLE